MSDIEQQQQSFVFLPPRGLDFARIGADLIENTFRRFQNFSVSAFSAGWTLNPQRPQLRRSPAVAFGCLWMPWNPSTLNHRALNRSGAQKPAKTRKNPQKPAKKCNTTGASLSNFCFQRVVPRPLSSHFLKNWYQKVSKSIEKYRKVYFPCRPEARNLFRSFPKFLDTFGRLRTLNPQQFQRDGGVARATKHPSKPAKTRQNPPFPAISRQIATALQEERAMVRWRRSEFEDPPPSTLKPSTQLSAWQSGAVLRTKMNRKAKI